MLDLNSGNIEGVLEWHLLANHFPPVPYNFFEPAKQAIEYAKSGEWNEIISLPDGREVPTFTMVKELHLEPFVEQRFE